MERKGGENDDDDDERERIGGSSTYNRTQGERRETARVQECTGVDTAAVCVLCAVCVGILSLSIFSCSRAQRHALFVLSHVCDIYFSRDVCIRG